MLKKLIGYSSIVILLASCVKGTDNSCQYKESSAVAPASEVASLQTYINANHPGAIQHSSGLFYEIVSPGTGTTNAGVCNNVTVKYTGTLTNGTQFDQNLNGITFTLGGLILGWQKGIPLITAGGSINLYLPPSLGYGNNAVGSIPANSILVFNIQLVAVQ